MTSLLNIAGNIPVVEAGGQSLRFEDGDSAYLSWTPASAGNRKTWTWSGWVKRGNLGVRQHLFDTTHATNDNGWFTSRFLSTDKLYIDTYNQSITTDAVFRDPSAWYHVVIAVDTTQATNTDRWKIFVNGVRQSVTGTYPSQNLDTGISTANSHNIGRYPFGSSYHLDGYLANVAFIDGQALDPTSFGEYDNTLWKPKSDADITGNLTFGTNGFYLPFKQTTEAEGFSTVTYTGNGGTQSIEGVGFEPSLVWIKRRDAANNHGIFDSVRGATKRLSSNRTNAEDTVSGVTSFDSNGFTLSTDYNESGASEVAWCWDAGTGSAASNTDGSITSSVKANTAKGFSISTYTGNGTSGATIGHGLSSAPEMVIVKNRTSGYSYGWNIYHSALGATKGVDFTTSAASTLSSLWNDTAPTSSVVTVGNIVSNNRSGNDFVMYSFHSVSGYSSIGSYTGTGAAGNSITGLGFKPAWIMIKDTTNAGNSWVILDNTRDTIDPRESGLFPDGSYAESDLTTGYISSFDSDGFTVAGSGGAINISGATMIYMAFADTRDATFFGDTSGNSNNWTPNALNNTDVVPDSPVTGGNFATLNPLTKFTSNTSLAEGNLKANATASGSGSNWGTVFSSITLPTTGKYYVEGRAFINTGIGNSSHLGVLDTAVFPSTNRHSTITYAFSTGEGFDGVYLTLFNNYAQPVSDGVLGTAEGSITGTSALVMLAVDIDNGKVWAGYNGTWLNSGDPAAGTNEIATRTFSSTDAIAVGTGWNGSNDQGMFANFGQDSSFAGNETPQGNTDDNGVGDFYYAPPSGFLALTTGNLPTPSITAPDEYFNTVLYTGDGTTDRDITGYDFQPDFLWHKARNKVYNHYLFDVVRGNSSLLKSNTTQAENTGTTGFNNFISNGFNIDQVSSWEMNESGSTYANWGWKAGGNAVSNTDGSITSSVSANQDAGFSIVSYTGTGANATVGHGLTSAPELFITKSRDDAYSWGVFSEAVGNTKVMYLENTTGAFTDATFWNSTSPTSTVFSLGSELTVNKSGSDYIAYCFHSVEGYSKIGSYTGNGSSDGTFVHLGFRPAYLWIKCTTLTQQWYEYDNHRETYNDDSYYFIKLSTSEAEALASGRQVDFLSNGFKPRGTDNGTNGSGQTYIYYAVAEAPFKSANAR